MLLWLKQLFCNHLWKKVQKEIIATRQGTWVTSVRYNTYRLDCTCLKCGKKDISSIEYME